MARIMLVVAALLLTHLVGIAAAAEPDTELTSKKARKLMATLKMLGLDSKELTDVVVEIDSHMDDDNYLSLAERSAPGGKVMFRYELSPHIGTRQFEMRYQFNDSPANITARTQGVMLNYNIKF